MDIDQLDNWRSLWRALVVLGLAFFPAYVFGRLVSPPSSSRSLNLIVGFNCLGIVGLGLGFLPSPYPILVLALIFLVLVAYWFRSGDALSDLAELRSFISNCRKLLNCFVLLAVILTMGPVLTYPAGWDELAYHIQLPRRWSAANAITVQGDLPYSALPSLFEIVSTLVSPVEVLIVPRLFVWGIWLSGALLLVQLTKQYSEARNGFVLAICAIISPIALMVSANCYVEALIWSNSIAILYLLIQSKFTQSSQAWLLLGILIGGSIATKMTSVGLLLLPVVFWNTSKWPNSAKQTIWPTVSTIATAIVFALPFYLRTWWFCGNPISPYYADYFSSNLAAIETSQYHHDLAVGNFGIAGWSGSFMAPIAVAFANELYDGSFGYQWLILLGLSIYHLRHRDSMASGRALPLAICAFGLSLIWIASSQQARFALQVYPLVVLLAATGMERLSQPWQRWIRLGLLATSIISLPWTNMGYYLDSWLCVMKIRQPVDYIRDGIAEDGYVELAEYLHQHLLPDDRVVTLFEHRLAYLPLQVEIGTPYFQSKYFVDAENASSESIMAELRNNGVNYLVITANPIGPDVSSRYIQSQQDWYRKLDRCIADGSLQVIWRSGDYAVAQVRITR